MDSKDSQANILPFNPTPPLLLLFLVAFALRLFQLGAQSLWYDEAVSLFIARQPIPDLIAHTAGDIHPPLYYLLLHVWLSFAGASEFSAAFFSLFFGVLIVALGFRLARGWFGLNAGFLTALLITFSSFNLWYSQEVRMYTLVGCLALLSLMALARLVEFQISNRSPRVRRGFKFQIVALAYVVIIAIGLYTQYYFIFLWIFQYLVVTVLLVFQWVKHRSAQSANQLVTQLPNHPTAEPSCEGDQAKSNHPTLRRLKHLATRPLGLWHLLQVAIVILFAPWLPTAIRQATEPPVPPWRSFVAWPNAVGETLTALAVGQSLPLESVWPLVVVAVLLYLLGLITSFLGKRSGPRTTLFLFGVTFAPLTIILLASLAIPLYHVRYMFIYAAAFYVVLALGLRAVARVSLLVTVVLLGMYVGGSAYADYLRRFDPAYAKDDYRSAVQFIAERARLGDAVLINAGYIYPTFVYYYPGVIDWRGRLADYRGDERSNTVVVAQTGSLGAPPSLGWGSPTSDFYATDESSTARALDLLLSRHPRVWMLRANDTVNDPNGFIRSYLKTHAVEFDEVTAKGSSFVKAQGFLASKSSSAALPSELRPTAPLSVTLGQQIALLGWSGPPTTTADSELKLVLFWQSLTPLDTDFRVSLGLFDATGRRWALADGVPVGALLPTGDWPVGQVLPDARVLTIPLGTPPGAYGLQVSLYDPLTNKSLAVPGGADGTRALLGRIQVVRPPANQLAAQNVTPFFQTQPVFDDNLALDHYDVSAEPVRPGEAIHAELMWRALNAPLEDQVVFLQLLDERGRLWATQESAPVESRYPTSQWAAGESVRDAHDLPVPPDAPDGRYHVVAGLYRARNRERLNVRNGWWPFGSDSLELATVEVKGRERVLKAPTNVGTPTRARFGDGALLIGYSVPPSVTLSAPSPAASQNLTVTLYWQALAPMQTSYKVFVHLVGANQQIVAQRDSEPGDGSLPTTGWLEGEYLTDRYVLELRPDLPPGDYTIYVGFYDPRTSVRLPIADAENKNVGDRWLLRRLSIR